MPNTVIYTGFTSGVVFICIEERSLIPTRQENQIRSYINEVTQLGIFPQKNGTASYNCHGVPRLLNSKFGGVWISTRGHV